MRCRLFLRLAILSGSALMLTNCATSLGSLSVNLGPALKECQKLGGKQPVPSIEEDGDYRVLSDETLGAIKKEHDGIDARTKCENDVIARYKAGK